MEALLSEDMNERDATTNDEATERVFLAVNEEAAARDPVTNPEIPVLEVRSTLERVQECVCDWKRFTLSREQSWNSAPRSKGLHTKLT